MYYYLYLNREVVACEAPKDIKKFKQYVPLTPEQKAFYLANPGATIQEVLAAKLQEQRAFDIEAYKEQRLSELKQLDLLRRQDLCADYVQGDALLNIANGTPDTIITGNKTAAQVIEHDAAVNMAVKAERHRVRDLILEAETKEAVDAAFASNEINTIEV